MKEVVGTCYYLAPEVLKREYTQASDLWSLGVVIYMMVTGSVPFCTSLPPQPQPLWRPVPSFSCLRVRCHPGSSGSECCKRALVPSVQATAWVHLLGSANRLSAERPACVSLVPRLEYTACVLTWVSCCTRHGVWPCIPFCLSTGGKNNDEIIASVKKETEDNDKMQNERLIPRLRKRRISEECIAFIMGLLTVDPQQRLSAGQALEHAWIVDEASSGGAATLGDNFTDAEFQESEDQLVLQLKNFKKMDMLKRTALLAMSLELSSEDLVMLNKSFAQADQNGDGLISFKEFQEMMEKKGVKDHAQVQAAFQAIDQDGAGLIQYVALCCPVLPCVALCCPTMADDGRSV